MKTSRIIRVGTRNYILRIAAVSQEHVLECRTRRRNTAGQGHGSKVGIEINLVVVWVVEIDGISAWGIGVDMISVWALELTWFCVGVENDLVRSLDRN